MPNYLDCYYSTTEKKAFWVSGYDDWSVASIQKDANRFAKRLGIASDKIETTVMKGGRFNEMRVFFADVEKCPNKFLAVEENSMVFLKK